MSESEKLRLQAIEAAETGPIEVSLDFATGAVYTAFNELLIAFWELHEAITDQPDPETFGSAENAADIHRGSVVGGLEDGYHALITTGASLHTYVALFNLVGVDLPALETFDPEEVLRRVELESAAFSPKQIRALLDGVLVVLDRWRLIAQGSIDAWDQHDEDCIPRMIEFVRKAVKALPDDAADLLVAFKVFRGY